MKEVRAALLMTYASKNISLVYLPIVLLMHHLWSYRGICAYGFLHTKDNSRGFGRT